MSARKAKILSRVVDALAPGEIIWDTELAGFGVRCQKRDKVYILKTRINGRQRWMTIGKHGAPYSPDKARSKAKILLGHIEDGKDPAQLRDDNKNLPTIKDLMKRFMEDHALEHKKAHSIASDARNIKNYVTPLLGNKHVATVTIADIDSFKRAVKAGKGPRGVSRGTLHPHTTGGPIAANKCLALLSKAMNLAIKWGWRTDNPVSHVAKYKENKIERFLSESEIAALAAALATEERAGANPYAIAAIRLLMFTGARRGEILGLKWSDVHFDKNIILLPDSKTGAKPIYLNAPAKEALTNLPRQKNNPYVVCGLKAGSHLKSLKRIWNRVRERATLEIWCGQSPAIDEFCGTLKKGNTKAPTFAKVLAFIASENISPEGGLMDVRLHDLRHTFASIGAMGGLSLPIIGKLLGHTQTATTQRYAHLADDPLRMANDAVGERLSHLMNPKNVKSKVTHF